MPIAPHGTWPSPFSAADAAAASCDFAELKRCTHGLLWSRFDPQDARTTLWLWRGGEARCLTPAGVSLRSRVHEYGGGAFCATAEGVAFVNEADQQLYLQSVDGEPRQLTRQPGSRYGDLQFDARGQALLAVEECHAGDGVRNRLVSIALADGASTQVAEGADFYAAPVLDSAGQRLAWIEWNRPEQPWTVTRLCEARRNGEDAWQAHRLLAGGAGDEALQQPRFSADDRLLCLSDRNGWWQPWEESSAGWRPVPGCLEADHAAAPWQLGACSWLPLEVDGLLLSRFEQGFGVLLEQGGAGERRLAPGFSRFRGLTFDAAYVYTIATAPDRLPAVIAIDRRDGHVEVLTGGERPLIDAQLSRPEPLAFGTGQGERAHGFFYPPRNAEVQGPADERPPLLVFMHGGPTSACYPQFDPRIQFWTQRGFAVLDLNYRGSSGYGRAYRQRLRGEWGRIEVEDACAAVAHLAATGRIDGARAFIRGGSAGGYSALLALADSRTFRAGASLYGVSDPLALRRVTHKFEADYLDWLIGDPVLDADRYHRRTPLQRLDDIEAPLIFFQGGRDAVVVPAQTHAMVDALRHLGREVDLHLYPHEGHGFRQAANLAHALEAECGFYRRLL